MEPDAEAAKKEKKRQYYKEYDAKRREKKNEYNREHNKRIKNEDPERYKEMMARAAECRRRMVKERPEHVQEQTKKSWQRLKSDPERKKKHDATRNTPEKLLKSYKTGAKKRHLSWTISDHFAIMMFHDRCHYCHKTPEQNQRLMGIDRIDNARGYDYGNVVPCCKNCNRAKHNLHVDDFRSMCTNVARFHGPQIKERRNSI